MEFTNNIHKKSNLAFCGRMVGKFLIVPYLYDKANLNTGNHHFPPLFIGIHDS